MPLTPPDEVANQLDNIDASTKLPDTPMADQFEESLDGFPAEPEPDAQKPHLVTHAKVYAIAEK